MALNVSFVIVLIIKIVYTSIPLTTGCFILYRAIKTKLTNLYALVALFFFNACEGLYSLFSYALPFEFYAGVLYFANIMLLVFVKFTFFQDRKSKFVLFFTILGILKIVNLILKLNVPFSIPQAKPLEESYRMLYYLDLSILFLMIFISYSWFASSSLNYYKRIKDAPIQPWIKVRYLIIGISSIFSALNAIVYLFYPFNTTSLETPLATTLSIIITVNTFVFAIGNLIAWVFPKKLRYFFNDVFESAEDEIVSIPEQKVMEIIKSEINEEGLNGNN